MSYPSMLCMHHLIEPAREEAIIMSISQMVTMRQSEAKTAHPSCYSQSLVELAFNSRIPRRMNGKTISFSQRSARILSKTFGAR